MKKDIRKIFISKQGGIGDVILATPVIKELKRLYPESYITLLILENARDLVDGLPFIDEVMCYNKKRDSFFKLWRKLLNYDAAIFLDLTYRIAMTSALAGVPIRAGIEHKRKFWLSKNIKWQESMDYTYEPYVLGHIVNEALDLNIPQNHLNKPYVASATEKDRAELMSILSANGISEKDKYITSSPITAFYLKDWPLDRWDELYRRIYDNYGLRTIVFGGGKLDYKWNKESVIDLWGKLNLRQVGQIIKDSVLLVNSCSLPVHIANAMGTPTAIIYGYTASERWAPREKCERIITHLSCSPCDGYNGSACTDPKCMNQMTVDEVYAACERQLKKYLRS